jgi:3-methyladenine DNA glycosylase AlkC
MRDIAEDEQYCTKRLANNVIKITCVTPETYRKLVKYFKTNNNIFYHTYQLKENEPTELSLNIYITQQILKI